MSSEVENSQQYNELTMSDNGTNVRAVLKAVSHFFLEDNSFEQTPENSFGPTSQTQFRTTAKVTFSGNKNVYTVCQGEVLVQPQTEDDTKVNVILKPYKQPINSISIKYFIYRGLNKDDFFNTIQVGNTTRLEIAGSESTGTGFVRHLWKEFNKFYSEIAEQKPKFLEEFIGYPAGSQVQNLTDLIDTCFYKIAQYDEQTGEEIEGKAYELPIIPRGVILGTATDKIGFDVVLNNGDYYIENDTNPFQLNLAFARAEEGILDTANGTTDFEEKLIRESCTWFIDPVAFYGVHANGHGKLYVGESPAPFTSNEDIYTLLNPFHTKNTIYLYIQSNRQRSYNFYGNYVLSPTNNNNLKTGISETNMTESVFGTMEWSIQIITSNSPVLAIQFTTDSNPDLALYAITGKIISPHEDNYVRISDLLPPPPLDENAPPVLIDYTQSVIFSFEESNNNTISSPVFLLFEGCKLSINDNTTDDLEFKDIDDSFGMIVEKSFIENKKDLELPTITESKGQLITFHYPNKESDIGVINIRRIEDALKTPDENYIKRITYETLLHNIRRDSSPFSKISTSDEDSSGGKTIQFSLGQNNYFQPEEPYLIETLIFTDGTESVKGLMFDTSTNTVPTKKILGITKEENQRLIDLVDFENLINPKFFFRNKLNDEENYFISPEEINYKVYSLEIIAENNEGENTVYTPEEIVTVYSLDGFIYSSSKYAENIPEFNLEDLSSNIIEI